MAKIYDARRFYEALIAKNKNNIIDWLENLLQRITTMETAVSRQYMYFTDGSTSFRMGVRGGKLYVDKALTETGFAGMQDVDWENLNTIE